MTCLALLCSHSVVGAADASQIPCPLVAAYFHPQAAIPPNGSTQQQSDSIRESLDRMRRSGFNAVFPYFTGSSGQAYFRSRILPQHVFGDRDPLAELTREARARGIQVYAVICVTVSGNDRPAGILLEHPQWGLRHPDGSPLGYISPAHPEARAWLVTIAQEILVNYPLDGIVLDYIRYHNRPLLLDVAAEERFRASLPADATAEQVRQRLQQFKEDELSQLVAQYAETVHAAGRRLGIYSWGPHVAANHQIAQCWPRWVRAGYLDLVNVSGYYHREKYGDKYLAIFAEKMRSSVVLNDQTGRPVPLSFALGVETSHGRIHAADEVWPYLREAGAAGLDGCVAFTWTTLLPYLDALDAQGTIASEFEP